MAKTRTLDGDRLVACAVALMVHVLLAWWAVRLLATDMPGRESDTSLQLFWVPALPQLSDAAADAPSGVRTAVSGGPSSPDTPVELPVPISEPISSIEPERRPRVDALSTGSPSAATQHATPWSIEQPTIQFVARDLLARRPVELPGRSGRMQLRERIGAADVVAKIATVFGGAGYSTDPCPELRKDVNDLSLAGDSKALQDALYYEKRACR